MPLALALCWLLTSPRTARAGDPEPILLVTSRDAGPYAGVVSGVQAKLAEAQSLSVRLHSLEETSEEALAALRQARGRTRVPVITVGSSATRAALDAPGGAPVISCMMAGAADLGEHREATGVMLEFPMEVQLEAVRRFLPNTHSVGVVYNPEENRETIEKAKSAAKKLELRLVAQAIERPEDLPGALDSLAREADVLFAVTDKMVLSPQTAQAILLFTFRNRMPFAGLSASWVKAGALYALERDYEDLGNQCAEMALKVLRGTPVTSIPVSMPRKVTYVLNERTAEHLRLRLPASVVDGASEVFR